MFHFAAVPLASLAAPFSPFGAYRRAWRLCLDPARFGLWIRDEDRRLGRRHTPWPGGRSCCVFGCARVFEGTRHVAGLWFPSAGCQACETRGTVVSPSQPIATAQFQSRFGAARPFIRVTPRTDASVQGFTLREVDGRRAVQSGTEPRTFCFPLRETQPPANRGSEQVQILLFM
jgi:hypothetical protein